MTFSNIRFNTLMLLKIWVEIHSMLVLGCNMSVNFYLHLNKKIKESLKLKSKRTKCLGFWVLGWMWSVQRCSKEMHEALQMSMEGHARLLEQHAKLQEEHITLLGKKIREGVAMLDVQFICSRSSDGGNCKNVEECIVHEHEFLKV